MTRFKYLFLILSVLILYVSYLQFNSYKLQAYLLRDLNTTSFDEQTFNLIKEEKFNFPSVGVTVLPLKSMKAEYFFRDHQYEKSLEYLYESLDYNPYIGFTEHYLSLNYDRLNIKDSFYTNAKKAFYKVPNNPAHFGYYAKALNQRNQTDSIIIEFQKVKKTGLQRIWTYFLGSLVNKNNYDSVLKLYAIEAKQKFSSPTEDLAAMIDLALYGKEDIEKSDSLFSKANKLAETGDFENSFLLYKKAIELYPTSHKYYQNLGIAYSKNNQFNLGIEQFKYVIENLNPKNGENEFYLALAYFNLGEDDLGCPYLKESFDYGYKPSLQLYKQKCQG